MCLKGKEGEDVLMVIWINNQLDAKDDVFIGVSTCFGHHHAHHQENGTKSTVTESRETIHNKWTPTNGENNPKKW
jgi:hypothetical protein